MDFIIIKHYMCELDSDFREINIDKIKTKLNKMKKYAKESGKKLIYLTMTSVYDGFPADSDPYAEVEYTGDLREDEKNQYVHFLKQLSLDEDYWGKNPRPLRCILQAVRFTKISGEVLPIR